MHEEPPLQPPPLPPHLSSCRHQALCLFFLCWNVTVPQVEPAIEVRLNVSPCVIRPDLVTPAPSLARSLADQRSESIEGWPAPGSASERVTAAHAGIHVLGRKRFRFSQCVERDADFSDCGATRREAEEQQQFDVFWFVVRILGRNSAAAVLG